MAPARIQLRYAGSCQTCGAALKPGTQAGYDRISKLVTCLGCAPGREAVAPRQRTADSAPIAAGTADSAPIAAETAGASARREHERRTSRRAAGIRAAHPKMGGLILALSDDPQSTKSWAIGARGEELLAKRLDKLADRGVLLLHDRRIPGTRANIDHLAVCTTGVHVIDAKRYQGRPQLRVEGGLFRPRIEKLLVGSRDRTELVLGVKKQVELVRRALDERHSAVAVHGMLCFIEANWPLIGGAFSIAGIDALWPAKAQDRLLAEGPLTSQLAHEVHRQLARWFPEA